MVFVVTADQRSSRRRPDLVDQARALLAPFPTLRAFERTAGDELQGVLDAAAPTVDVVLALVRDGGWSVGLGIGPVELPLPVQTRAGRGPAFEYARDAVTRAKSRAEHVALTAAAPGAADAEALLSVHAAIVASRSEAGWEAVDLVATGMTQTQAAACLGVSKQAVSQRLRAAWWESQLSTRSLLLRLLDDLDAA